MSNVDASPDPGRMSGVSTANVALGIALIPLLLMYKADVDPMAEFLWTFNQPDAVSGFFWQSRLADLLSIGLLTLLVYVGLRRSGFDRRIRPSGIALALIGVAAALPALWSAYLLWLAVRQEGLADLYGSFVYDRRLMVEPMLVLCTMATAMLVLAHWVDVRFSVRRRRREAG